MEFLLEIGTEEIPASHILVALSQLEEKIRNDLSAADIHCAKLETYGTCRRLVVSGNFAAGQEDKVNFVVGPPKAVAFLPDGSPSPAATGFARSQGVKVGELEVVQTSRGEYLGLKKTVKGKPTGDVLQESLPRIISQMSFPKMMRWGENPMRFSRPITHLFCLFDRKKLDFQISGIPSTAYTTGHKIYTPDKISVKTFAQYRDALRRAKVIIEPERRKRMILEQAKKKLASLEAQLFPDDSLMEKLVYDVEYPHVFIGSFPQDYLNLPIDVLSTAMRVGQNLFSVVKGQKQLPYFLGVADAFRDKKSLIRKGNARVLKARIEDAKFFWEQDFKLPLRKRAKGLNRIVFQEKLGSYEDKSDRLKKIVAYLARRLEENNEKKDLVEAAGLCKADLLTEMVREFPSLQGRVGGLYAREEGYSPLVWKGIYEHYQPQSLDDDVPSSASGSILSIADKMDSIVGVLGVGVEVTGSKDPFGLRRNAQGVCKIILDKKLDLSLERLLDKVIVIYGEKLDKEKDELKSYCLEFFKNRLEYIFESSGYRYDLVNSALATGFDNVYFTSLRLKALDSLKDSPQFEPLIQIAKRVNNILRDVPVYKMNSELFDEKEERELYTTFTIIRDNVLPLIAKGDFQRAHKMIFRIRTAINSFFDRVLVMTEDRRTQRNRLALLQEISRLFSAIADYSKIVIEG